MDATEKTGEWRLINMIVPEEEIQELKHLAGDLPSLQLTERQVWDLECLAIGAFSPLDRFMGEQDYSHALGEMRLGDGSIFPIPVTLPVSKGAEISLDNEVALRDSHNELLGTMIVEEIYKWSREEYEISVLGTQDLRHPLAADMHRWGALNISGSLRVFHLPKHHDFSELRMTPKETRSALSALGRSNAVAFQTRNPLHRVHEELTKRAIEQVDGVLLLHPVVGMTKPGDVDHYTRVRTYKAMASKYYEPDRVVLALLPLAMRFAGPREALWHAIIRRNYGANFLVVGRDHASPGLNSKNQAFYLPFAAQELVDEYSEETGVSPIAFDELVYLPAEDAYVESSSADAGSEMIALSGSEVREEYLNKGLPLPEWIARPEVSEILADAHPPRHQQGVCIWFTGLPGAGKSTTAELLTSRLMEHGRPVTLLDGDVVRTHLSKGLGFDRDDRDTNIRRIGFVAAEIVRHGGVVVCAAVSPYRSTRNDVRNMVGQDHYLEVFVDTPLEVCEARDTKGLYARARRGEIKGFTGIDDPYEAPENPEIVLNTVDAAPKANAERIVELLSDRGFLRSDS